MSVILKLNDVTDAIHICEALVAEAERMEGTHPTMAKRFHAISEALADSLDRLPDSTFARDRTSRLGQAQREDRSPATRRVLDRAG